MPGITQKMLTQTLRRLERDGLVNREVLGEMRPPQVEYSLTELGHSAVKPLAAIGKWSEDHLPDVKEARRLFDERMGRSSRNQRVREQRVSARKLYVEIRQWQPSDFSAT